MTKDADYRRIDSITDDIVLVDMGGNVSRLGTAEAYELFQMALQEQGLSLYDEVERRWHSHSRRQAPAWG